MIITLVPVAQLPGLPADIPPQIQDTIIFYRGEVYDFTPLIPGYEIEPGLPFEGVVKNIDGVIHARVLYHFDTTNALIGQSTNLDDYTFSITNGLVPDPIRYNIPEPEVAHVGLV